MITELVFHPTLYLIACTSNKSSIHLFEIKKSVQKCIDNKEYGFSQGDNIETTEADNKKSK